MMRVIAGVVPPGGWHYKQPLNSSPQRPQQQLIGAASYEALVENVFQFRLNNLQMVESGSATRELVVQDIQFYICGNWPRHCTGAKAEFSQTPGAPISKPAYARPLTRIEDWLTLLSERQLRWVDQGRALERAKVCVACPLNRPWRTGCAPCNDNADRRAMLILGSRSTGLESQLRSCLAYGTLLKLSVWLEEDFTGPRNRPEPPQECWKLTEAKNA